MRDRTGLAFEDLGEQEVKNINRPVRVFRVLGKGQGVKVRKQRPSPTRTVAVAAAVLLILVLGGGIWWWWVQPGQQSVSPDTAASQSSEKPSIAVLPFANLSGDPAQDYFSDGLTQNLISSLSNLYGLFVISANSSFAYKGKAVKVQQVAEELGVQFVLEGSVQKSGNRVRFNTQLVDALTGRHMWSERYDRDFEDLFKVQDEIVKNVVTALQVELIEGEAMRTFSSTTRNPEAFEYASRVRKHYLKRTKQNNAEGIRLARKAIELDPNYSRVWVSLGWFYQQQARQGWAEDKSKAIEQARAAVDRALEIDESLSDAYALLGQIALRFDRDHERAIELGRKATELNLNNFQNWSLLGFSLAYGGEPEEAVGALKRAIRLSPFHPPFVSRILGDAYLLSGKLDAAAATYRDLLEVSQSGSGQSHAHLGLALVYADQGREDDARAEVSKAVEKYPKRSLRFQKSTWTLKDEKTLERFIETWQRLGLPE